MVIDYMRKLLVLSFLLVLLGSVSFAQNTSVTGQVTDTASQTWNNGTFTFTFVGPSNVQWTGGPFPSNPITGSLSTSGAIPTTNVPDNNQVNPPGTQWTLKVCSATLPQACFSRTLTITGATQNISMTPPAIKFTVPTSPIPVNPITGYADGEISGGWVGFQYYNLVSTGFRVCTASFANSCNAWTAVGSGGGGSNILPGTALSQVPTWNPTSAQWVPQNKAIYNTADWMTCDGVTNASAGMGQLLSTIGSSHATIQVSGQCQLTILPQPANVTFEFTPGGSIGLILNTTAPGGGTFVQGSGQSNPAASPTSTCSVTLSGTTAGNAVLMMVSLYNTFGPDNARISSVTDTKDLYVQQMQTTLANAGYMAAYVASSIAGGSLTINANFTHAEKNACIAWEISGLGPVVAIDSSNFAYGSTTPFSSGSATLAAGDFVASFSEDPNDAQTCTAGAGYTQPSSLAGNVGTGSTNGVAMCAEFVNSGAGGATSATQNFSSSPVLSTWVSAIIGLKPGIATWNALGGIYDPDNHQICVGCTGTSGILDFTGNLVIPAVLPEWWGACFSCTAAVNTPAIQASENGAFGSGPVAKRINGSGLNIYNKVWYLDAPFQINGEIQFYHVSGNAGSRAQVYCAAGGGLTQTASNLRILDGQSDAYLRFDNCIFSSTASNTGALIDLGYSSLQGVDFAPQFIDFYGVTWGGANVTAIGLLGAKEGGGAQFSNVYCYDCEANGFTTAAWQVGTPTKLAQNALAIAWYGGDMQSNPQYGFASYGAGFIYFFGTSFEDNYALQTGADVLTGFNQGPVFLYGVRSESRVLCLCDTLDIVDSRIIDQDAFVSAGTSDPVGTYMTGSSVGGDGAHYKVTVDGGPFSGFGSQNNNLIFQASGGSTSTLVDTNQSLTGSVTILTASANGETVTQAVTGSTATMLTNPAVPSSLATITGTATSGQLVFNEIIKQSVTNVTATEQAPSPVSGTTQSLFANNFSGTADSTHTWVGQTSGAVYTPSAAPSFAATTMYITAATGSPDNTHNWTGGTSGFVFTPTQAPQSVNWTVNGFAGQTVSIFQGANGLCYAPIASNTVNTITITGSWLTRYPPTFIAGPTQVAGSPCSAPDSTSTFIVEPTWNHGTVTSGGMTLQYANENVVGGGNAPGVVFAGRITDTWLHSGGQLAANTNGDSGVVLSNVIVSRQDWLPGSINNFGATHRDWDVRVSSPINRERASQNWQYPTSGGGISFLGAMHRDFGTTVFCWNTGSLGNVTANEVCVGGRSDPVSGTSASRAIFEIYNTIGPPTPYQQVNANGGNLNLQGGLPSGSGTPGNINFATGNAGASGTSLTDGTNRWQIIGATGHLFAFADNTYDIGASGANRPRNGFFGSAITANTYNTNSNCSVNSASPAACGSAASGAVVIPTTTTTYTINTTAVTAHSRIQLTWLTFASDLPSSPTCVAPSTTTQPTISNIVAGTSFTITLTSTTGTTCPQFDIKN